MRDLTPIEASYIAGFFDGEGSIFIAKTKDKNGLEVFYDCISITNTNFEILCFISDTSGVGNVNVHQKQKGKNRASWVWRLYGHEAQSFLRAILPYLKVKRTLAEILLTFPRGVSGYRDLELQEVRRLVHAKIKEINAGVDDQGVTTIPPGSTSEANADGSARHLAPDQAERNSSRRHKNTAGKFLVDL